MRVHVIRKIRRMHGYSARELAIAMASHESYVRDVEARRIKMSPEFARRAHVALGAIIGTHRDIATKRAMDHLMVMSMGISYAELAGVTGYSATHIAHMMHTGRGSAFAFECISDAISAIVGAT
jgi:transcriptional regulator with XRE-family HTH domain